MFRLKPASVLLCHLCACQLIAPYASRGSDDAASPDAAVRDSQAAVRDGATGESDLAHDGPPPPSSDSDQDAGCVTKSQRLTITANGDDGEIDAGKYFLPRGEDAYASFPAGIFVGYWNQDFTWAYFRFSLAQPIPVGAKIQGATLALDGLGVNAWNRTVHALRIFAERTADAKVVASLSDRPNSATGRALTGSSVRWPKSGGLDWKTATFNKSPDLSSLLSELVTRFGGLETAAAIQLWLRGDFRANAEVITPDLSRASGSVAKLQIVWCE